MTKQGVNELHESGTPGLGSHRGQIGQLAADYTVGQPTPPVEATKSGHSRR